MADETVKLEDVRYIDCMYCAWVPIDHANGDGWIALKVDEYDNETPEGMEDTITRACATQNACIGIPTAELEGVSVKAMREALESAADALRVVDENGSDGFSATVSMALANVRTALGKDEPK